MKLRNHYQWIVMGDHPAALASAGLAAKLGLSVLIVPLQENSRVVITVDGRVHDSESGWFSSLSSQGEEGDAPHLVRSTLLALGATPSEMSRLTDESAVTEMKCDRKRFKWNRDLLSWRKQWLWNALETCSADRFLKMEILLRASDRLLREFWFQLPDRLTWKDSRGQDKGESQSGSQAAAPLIRVPERELASRIEKGDPAVARTFTQVSSLLKKPLHEGLDRMGVLEFAHWARGVWDFLGPAAPREKSLFDWLHATSLSRSSVRVVGGAQRLRELLLRLALRNGADYAMDRDARRVFIRDQRLSGIQVSGSGTVITADGGVYGSRMTTLVSRLVGAEAKGIQKKLKHPSFQSEAEGLFLTLSLRVTEEAAAAIPDRWVQVDPEEGALEVEKVGVESYTGERTREMLVFLRSTLSYTESEEVFGSEKLLERLARMERTWSDQFPGVGAGVLSRFPDHTHLSRGNQDIEVIYPLRKKAELSQHHVGKWSHSLGSSTPFKNLFLVSSETYAQLGAGFGPWIGAYEATAWIAHRSGLPGPVAGDRGQFVTSDKTNT